MQAVLKETMRSADLIPDVRARLEAYPPPHQAHRGVVPAPPTRGAVAMGGIDVGRRVTEAQQALTRLGARIGGSAGAFALTRILERQEAVSSSAIEGTQSTLDALLELELHDDGDSDAETRETRGVSLALDAGLAAMRSEGKAAFSVALFCDLHRRLAGHVEGFAGTPGALREVVVWIGGRGRDPSTSTWNPPAPTHVGACLEDTAAYFAADAEDVSQISPLVRAAIGHAHFEAVHPFRDGNGRVGRLLIPLLFAAEGHVPLYLSAWIEAHRASYYDALKAAQQRLDHGPMIDLIARAVLGTEQEFEATLAAVETLEADWLATLRLRKNSTAARTVTLLKSYPVLTARRLESLLDVSFKAASDGLARLQELGVVSERTGYARNRVFVAPEMLRILGRPFGTPPDQM